MQDQNDNQAGEVGGEKASSEEFLAMLREAEAAVFVEVTAKGGLIVSAVTARGEFRPEYDPAHAFIAAVQGEHAHLMDVVNGRPNDATRFRALRQFALLKGSDEPRFNAINEMLQKFEHDHKLDDEAARKAEDHNAVADFIAIALLETEPVALHETTVNTDAPAIYTGPKLVLPH